jgi:cbb3-type cytochrome oxidase cytochrome c subunit
MASMLRAAWPEDSLLPTGVSGMHVKLGNGGHAQGADAKKAQSAQLDVHMVADTGGEAKNNHVAEHKVQTFGAGLMAAPPSHGGDSVEYVDKASGRKGRAVSQLHHWSDKYERESGTTFHLVAEFWEFPMRPRQYVEANCARCHTNITEIAAEAPTLHEGRTLFSKLGCVNCHQMDSIPADEPEDPFSGDKKRVGTDLRNIDAKLSPAFINSWIWAPKAFRPSTLMPHFFMLENNSSDEEIRRTRLEARAMTEYLLATANRYPQKGADGKPAMKDGKPVLGPWQPRHKLAGGVAGDAAKGKELFNALGCMGCHTNLADKNEDDVARAQQWIVRDLIRSGGLSEEDAVAAYEGMSYNQKQWYALQNFGALTSVGAARFYPPMDDDEKVNPRVRPIFMHHGPELSGIGDKLLSGRTPEQAKAWLFDWLKEPRHYSSYTVMPSLRLSDQEAAHLVEYLIGQKRTNLDEKDAWKAELFPVDPVKLNELVAWFLRSQYTPQLADKAAADPEEMRKRAVDTLTSPTILARADAEAAAKDMDLTKRQLLFVGKKLVTHYGCFNCHAINGMEGQASPCANLSDWGQKMVTRLAYEFLDPHKTHDLSERGVHASIPMVNALTAEATQIGSTTAAGGKGAPSVAQVVKVGWPELEHTRDSWLTQKLLNTRIYDRGKNLLEPAKSTNPDASLPLDARGRPYDKLKMPTFYLNERQAQAVVTFVVSNRNRLISPKLISDTNTDEAKRLARGRQVAERMNCVSCHHTQGNYPAIHQYMEAVKQEDMSKFWMIAPPDLKHEGNRIQHSWLFNFLKNVEPIRPMVPIRMPSFPVTDDEAQSLAAYFNAISQHESRWLKKRLESIEKVVSDKKKASTRPATNPSEPWPGDDWYKPSVAEMPGAPGAKDPFAEGLMERKLKERFNQRQVEQWVEQWRRGGAPPVGRTVSLQQAVKDLVVWGVVNRLPQMTLTNLDANKTRGFDLDKTFRSLLFEARFLANLTDAPYPLVDSPRPDVSDEQFARGQEFFYALDCMKCHVLGDPKVTSGFKIEQPTQGPNLVMAHRRLQWRWVAHWVQQTNLILPVGSPMPPFFDGLPAWKLEGLPFGQDMPTLAEMAPDKRQTVQAHMARFGASAPEQKDLLLSFVYAAGVRNHTVKPPPATQPSATQPAQTRPAGRPPG